MRVHLAVYRGRLMENGSSAPGKKKEKERGKNQTSTDRQKKSGYKLQTYAPIITPPTHHVVSHCSAVLYAGLGGDVGPGQQRAQQGLGLSVQPLRDGAGAQAGQG